MKKFVIIGPESTGKTSLTKQLAEHYQCPMVEEFARSYIDQLDRSYEKDDLLQIARGQVKLEDYYQDWDDPYLFCDTDLRVIKVWSLFKYQDVHPWILHQIATRRYHGYLLTAMDLPWEPDPQREHPQHRQQLFDIYQTEIASTGLPFTVISGTGQERFDQAVDFIDKSAILHSKP